MTCKITSKSSNSKNFGKLPVNLRIVQQEQKISAEESFPMTEYYTTTSKAEDRCHWLNEILKWPQSHERKGNRGSQRRPFILTSQR